MGLRGGRFARTLQRPPVDEVHHNTVWQLLTVLVGRVRCLELSEVEALGDTLGIRDGGTEDKVAQGVDLDKATFPKLSSCQHSVRFMIKNELTNVSGNWMLRSPT